MAAPGLKEMARSRELKVGHFIVEFATPGIGQILKAAGCDFALFDTEHSGFGFETIKSVLRYMQAADLPTIVRVPSKEYHHIARAADMGAEGIMLPMVGSPEEARAILDCMKYYPHGRRGVALGGGARPLHARADARQARGGQPADHPVRPDRDPRTASRTPMRSPRSTASTACGSAISTSALARHPGPVRAQGLHRRDRDGGQGLPQARQGAGRLVPTVDEGGGVPRGGLRLHLLLGRRLGAARARCSRRSTRSATRTAPAQGRQAKGKSQGARPQARARNRRDGRRR